jgi:type IV secretory pathway TrbD component
MSSIAFYVPSAGGQQQASAEADVAIAAGQPVCLLVRRLMGGPITSNPGHLALAQANLLMYAPVGLALFDGTVGNAVAYSPAGLLTLSDWTAVVGSATLATGTIYYVSPDTAGQLASVAPTTSGQYVIEVGKALSPVQMSIAIRPPIYL